MRTHCAHVMTASCKPEAAKSQPKGYQAAHSDSGPGPDLAVDSDSLPAAALHSFGGNLQQVQQTEMLRRHEHGHGHRHGDGDGDGDGVARLESSENGTGRNIVA